MEPHAARLTEAARHRRNEAHVVLFGDAIGIVRHDLDALAAALSDVEVAVRGVGDHAEGLLQAVGQKRHVGRPARVVRDVEDGPETGVEVQHLALIADRRPATAVARLVAVHAHHVRHLAQAVGEATNADLVLAEASTLLHAHESVLELHRSRILSPAEGAEHLALVGEQAVRPRHASEEHGRLHGVTTLRDVQHHAPTRVGDEGAVPLVVGEEPRRVAEIPGERLGPAHVATLGYVHDVAAAEGACEEPAIRRPLHVRDAVDAVRVNGHALGRAQRLLIGGQTKIEAEIAHRFPPGTRLIARTRRGSLPDCRERFTIPLNQTNANTIDKRY